ncbi:hypothetical protein G7046_g8551 [Stylonectria norvegica]|nr:hypothetical protein G7046_g8551 [Stylonectria norvegica]
MEMLRLVAVAALFGLFAMVMAAPPAIYTPTPMLSPAFASCEQFHKAGVGENCDALVAAAGLSREDFFRLNPGIGGEAGCKDKIIVNTFYCFKAIGGPGGGGSGPPAGSESSAVVVTYSRAPASSSRAPASSSAVPASSSRAPAPSSSVPASTTKASTTTTKATAPSSGATSSQPSSTSFKPSTSTPYSWFDLSNVPKSVSILRPTRAWADVVTKGPSAASPYCLPMNDCALAFARIHYSRDNAGTEKAHAMWLCTHLFNFSCGDIKTIDFPPRVAEHCNNCADLSSVCPCFTEHKLKIQSACHGNMIDKYHSYLAEYTMSSSAFWDGVLEALDDNDNDNDNDNAEEKNSYQNNGPAFAWDPPP